MAADSTRDRVVVGFDGSEHAWRALEWATDETKRSGARLVIVHTFDYGVAAADQTGMVSLDVFAENARRLLDGAVSYAQGQQVEVEGRLEYGSAATALVSASRDAKMLVVGSRGRGGLAGALLGSVSIACVHHAACPVVVIPPPDRLVQSQHSGEADVLVG